MKVLTTLFILITLIGCNETGSRKILEYDGPLQEATNVEHLYSENKKVTVKLFAPKVLQFGNEDQEFPEGINLEFYDEMGNIESTISANHAYYYDNERKWKGTGNVIVRNLKKNEELKSEELYWYPNKETISTEKFVTVKQQNDVLYGNGLEAKQDLSYYKFTDLQGIIEIED